jgi:hypothetical protein
MASPVLSTSAPTLPSDSDPPIELVKINMARQHEKTGRDEFLATSSSASKPATGDDAGAVDADIVATLSHLAEAINQGLEFGPFRGEQHFAMEF